MPGIPTHLRTLDLCIEAMLQSQDPELITKANTLNNNRYYASLGAVGPLFGDFVPGQAFKPDPKLPITSPVSPYLSVWLPILEILGGGSDANPNGLLTIMEKLNNILSMLEEIAGAEDEGALIAREATLKEIAPLSEELLSIIQGAETKALSISSLIGGVRPSLNPPHAADPLPPPNIWHVRDLLHHHHTGAFVNSLLDEAASSKDERFLAYAYGYAIAYSICTVGSGHVNSIVGGPHRLHWWRHRWVNNAIDAWVHWYYNSGNVTWLDDQPTPGYSAGNFNLCNARLDKDLSMAGLDPIETMRKFTGATPLEPVLPEDFVHFWLTAFDKAYGTLDLFPRISSESLQSGAVMLWLILWVQTGGHSLACNPEPPATPPADCNGYIDSAPPWSDPNTPKADGTPNTPPEPAIENNPDVAEIITGILLAIFGGAAALGGALLGGGAAIVGGIALIKDGAINPNWSKLRCDLYWYRVYLFHAKEALHTLLTIGCYAHPYSRELANDPTVATLLGFEFTYDSGKTLTKSRNRTENYPCNSWNGAVADWLNDPHGVEEPTTVGYRHIGYPSWFINDPANPLANGDVLTPGNWPTRLTTKGLVSDFGNTVACAMDLLKKGGKLPPWNLDSDRGLAWHCWEFKTQNYQEPVEVKPES